MRLRDRFSLFRYQRKYRKDPAYNTIKTILSKNYNNIMSDIENDIEYTSGITSSDSIQSAMIVREAIDEGLPFNMLLSRKYLSKQQEVILNGLQDGLTEKQVWQYANPKYDSKQMEQIKQGLKTLPKEVVNYFKSPDFNYRQMIEIREAATQGLSEVRLKMITKPALHYSTIHEAAKLMLSENKIGLNTISDLVDKLKYASTYTMRYGLQLGLSISQINQVVENMASLHKYWDKSQFREMSREVCDEICTHGIEDIPEYFSEKFLKEETPSQELEVTEATLGKEESEKFDVFEADEDIKKKLQEQELEQQSETFENNISDVIEREPDVAISF